MQMVGDRGPRMDAWVLSGHEWSAEGDDDGYPSFSVDAKSGGKRKRRALRRWLDADLDAAVKLVKGSNQDVKERKRKKLQGSSTEMNTTGRTEKTKAKDHKSGESKVNGRSEAQKVLQRGENDVGMPDGSDRKVAGSCVESGKKVKGRKRNRNKFKQTQEVQVARQGSDDHGHQVGIDKTSKTVLQKPEGVKSLCPKEGGRMPLRGDGGQQDFQNDGSAKAIDASVEGCSKTKRGVETAKTKRKQKVVGPNVDSADHGRIGIEASGKSGGNMALEQGEGKSRKRGRRKSTKRESQEPDINNERKGNSLGQSSKNEGGGQVAGSDGKRENQTHDTKSKEKGGRGGSERQQNVDVPTTVEHAGLCSEGVGKLPGAKRMSKLMSRFHDRLLSGHFRYLNEQLYTKSGSESFSMMQGNKSLFEQYHRDYGQQMKSWSKQPVDVAIQWLKKKPKEWKVADFGCGEAKLAASVQQEVSSLDLVAISPAVIECDMASTPLGGSSQDAAVFCLALMGTNYPDYLKEATRVLKDGGVLWIAEVRSRFVNEKGKEEYEPFIGAVQRLGYRKKAFLKPSKLFVVLMFEKSNAVKVESKCTWPPLKACVYKRR